MNDKTDIASPSVYCIVVNWNGWKDTNECLKSLEKQSYPNLTTIVVDNGSTDDSVFQLQTRYPYLKILALDKNLGFSAGNNAGIRLAMDVGASYVWLLNNDTIVPENTIEKLIKPMSKSSMVGAVGSVLYYLKQPDQIQAWGGGSLSRFTAYSRHFNTPAVLGSNAFLTFASVLISRSAIIATGLLDESFFMYYEDVDYCWRLQKLGYKLAVAEDTKVLHKEGGSSKKKEVQTDRYTTRSGLLFLRRYSPTPMMSMILFIFARLLKRFALLRFSNICAVLQGIVDFQKQKFTDSSLGA